MGNQMCYCKSKSISLMDCLCLRGKQSPEQQPINDKKQESASSTNNDQNDEITTVIGSNYEEIANMQKANSMQPQNNNNMIQYKYEQVVNDEDDDEDNKLLKQNNNQEQNQNNFCSQNAQQINANEDKQQNKDLAKNPQQDVQTLINQDDIIQIQKEEQEQNITKKEEIIINIDTIEQIMARLNQAILDVQAKFQEDLSSYEKIYEEKEKGTKFVLYMKHYKLDNYNVAIYRQEWIVPCGSKQMMDFKNNFDIQKTMDSNMDQFQIVERFGELKNYVKLYLRYKKVLFASPRDFLYTKHYEKICDNPETWIDASQSVVDDANFPIYQGVERGRNILCGNLIEQIDDNTCRMKTYTEINLNLTLPLFMTKPASVVQMKNYVNRCYDYLVKEYSKDTNNL